MRDALSGTPAERDGRDDVLSVAEACARLGGISRATFYRLPYFRTRRIHLSPRRVGVLASEVERYIRIRSTAMVA